MDDMFSLPRPMLVRFETGVLYVLSVFFALALLEADKPNILFILADDLGIRDLSCEGSTFHETPHIDSVSYTHLTLPTSDLV